jgi:pyruvate dehydrogenase E1 component
MLDEQVDEYWYLTLMNENYAHPAMPEGAAEGIVKGMYLLRAPPPLAGEVEAAKPLRVGASPRPKSTSN